ncbi:MAG: MFS transporter [Alphaproteobacteria bacterium]|nr:MFS transporter [Alphaproteobacteria bacterium]
MVASPLTARKFACLSVETEMDKIKNFLSSFLGNPQNPVLIIFLLVFTLGFSLAMGFYWILLTEELYKRKFSTEHIAMVLTMGSIAFFVVGLFLQKLMRSFSYKKIYFFSALALCALIPGSVILEWNYLLFIFVFLIGIAVANINMLTDVLINRYADKKHLSTLLGLYTTVMAMGYGLGPSLVSVIPRGNHLPYLLCSTLILMTFIPVLFLKYKEIRSSEKTEKMSLNLIFLVPLALITAFFFGINDETISDLFPIYAEEKGYSRGGAGLLLTVLLMGGVFLPVFIGILADKFKRHWVLLACVTTLVLSFLIGHYMNVHVYVWGILLFLAGGTIASLDLLGFSLIAERLKGEELDGAVIGSSMIYSIGAIMGPLTAGLFMNGMGGVGLIWFIVIINLMFLGGIALFLKGHLMAKL